MLNLKLTKGEATELFKFCIKELERINKSTGKISKIISRLGKKPLVVTKAVNAGVAARKGAGGGKRGRPKNSIWNRSVLEVIQENKKPMLLKDLLKKTMKVLKIPASGTTKAKNNLIQSIYKLRMDKVIKSIKQPGTKIKLYGLTEWAGGDSPKRGRGRPAKVKKTARKNAAKKTVASAKTVKLVKSTGKKRGRPAKKVSAASKLKGVNKNTPVKKAVKSVLKKTKPAVSPKKATKKAATAPVTVRKGNAKVFMPKQTAARKRKVKAVKLPEQKVVEAVIPAVAPPVTES